MANRLFVFDMDGTLLIQTTACVEIAKATGTLHHLDRLEEQFARREIAAFCFARRDPARCGDRWTRSLSERRSKQHPSSTTSKRSLI